MQHRWAWVSRVRDGETTCPGLSAGLTLTLDSPFLRQPVPPRGRNLLPRLHPRHVLRQRYPQTVAATDAAHQAANLLKHSWEKDPRW